MTTHSSLFAAAKQHIPGGVNSPVRAFKAVGGEPIFIKRAQGAYIYDANDKPYIDYVGSWGPMILGHNAPEVRDAVIAAANNGLSFGAPTVLETEMAALICQTLPWIEKVRMVNSGTEATMSAIRLARGATGRDKIIKFAGCYHGHADGLLVKAGSGALTFGVADSAGVPAAVAAHTLTAEYNDAATAQALFAACPAQIAAVIVEPVAGNMNCVPPKRGFLPALRQLCDDNGALLIIDEVMTGFRVHPKGAQAYYGVEGDITCLGKIIGGGMPVGAFGGKSALMAQLAPDGGVYQAGTLSGNPVAMAAGLATLRQLNAPDFYVDLSDKTTYLLKGLKAAAQQHGVALVTNQVGGMFGMFFTEAQEVTNFAQVMACNSALFKPFFHRMLAQGVNFAPSPFEAGFMSAAHSYADLDATIAAANLAFAAL